MESLNNIKEFLDEKGLKIEKTVMVREKHKKLLSYKIKSIETDEEHALLSIWISTVDNMDDDSYLSKLDELQRKKFKQLKKIITPLYCYIEWINGSKKYKNYGKLIMLYVMLELSRKHIFIIKLDNSSGKKSTYKLFGFKDFQSDEEEIMSSVLLPKILKNMKQIKIE
jgi:hypothetical protein